MRFTFVAFVLLLASGYAMAQEFTYSVQRAGYPFDKYDEKGSVTYEEFVKEFESFPWATQVGRAKGGSEATISVRDHTSDIVLWVSAAQDNSGYVYLVGVVYAKERRGFLGLGKSKPVRWVEIYIAQDKSIVEKAFKVFFSGQDKELFHQLHQLPKFDAMEAKH